MGAFVSAFMLYGIALLYGADRHARGCAEIADALAGGRRLAASRCSLGFLLLVRGFGFKMSLVPFHAWSPDTYQGAPSPFVAFLSVAPKVASALVLMRLLDAGRRRAAPAVKWPQLVAAAGGALDARSATCSPWCSATSSGCSPTPASRTWATC